MWAKVLRLVGVVVSFGLLAANTSSAAADGILPTPDYSGDFFSRSTMTGDWGGPDIGMMPTATYPLEPQAHGQFAGKLEMI